MFKGNQKQVVHKDLSVGMNYFLFTLRMYVATLSYFETHYQSLTSWSTENNCMITSNLISSRSLIDFFFPNSKDKMRDITCFDYILEFRPEISQDNPIDLINIKKLIGDTVAHISREETTPFISLNDWSLTDVSNVFIPLLRNFLNELPSEHLDQERKEICLSEIAKIDNSKLPSIIHVST